MSSLDTLYYSLAVGFLILIGILSFLIWQLIRVVRIASLAIDRFKVPFLGLTALFSGLKLLKRR